MTAHSRGCHAANAFGATSGVRSGASYNGREAAASLDATAMRTMMRHALNIDERIVGRTRDDVWRRASEDDSTRRKY